MLIKNKTFKTNIVLHLFLVFFLLNNQANAKISLPAFFGNNMVLQQKSRVPLWGAALPDHKITIITSWNNKTYQTTTSKTGDWKINVSTPVYGGPYSITFNAGDTLIFKNVMIGEVWVCAGQSNMEMPVAGWGEINNFQQELDSARYSDIRLLLIDHYASKIPLNDVKLTQGGWQPCTPECIADFSAVAYFFARKIYQETHMPIGLVNVSWGGTVAEDWTSEGSLNIMPHFKSILEKMHRDTAKIQPRTLEGANHPSVLYNALIHPLIPLAIRGVIWYQGESNSDRSYQYRQLFTLLINDWRKNWHIGNFPFLFVQLANFNFGVISDKPKESTMAELREAQNMALSLPKTGMAVAIDAGDANQIHYKNKKLPAERLALVALAKVYKRHITYSGPMYKSARFKDNTVIISFTNTDGGLSPTGSLMGFAIAGADRHFYWAKAKIIRNKVVVWSPNVSNPVAVRYGWANNPDCNLYNGACLPASPFRTDDWPGITFGKE